MYIKGFLVEKKIIIKKIIILNEVVVKIKIKFY